MSRAEFLACLPMLRTSQQPPLGTPREKYDEADLLELFDTLDEDGSGELEYSELVRLLGGENGEAAE